MNTPKPAQQLVRLTRQASAHTRDLTTWGKEALNRAQHSLQERVTRAVQERLDDLVDTLVQPENAEQLQAVLARLAQRGFELGFRLDPRAGTLFRFVHWIESRHGRDRVLALVSTENLLTDGELINLLMHYAAALSPGRTGEEAALNSEDVERFKRQAGRRMLRLLAELAALEAGKAAPYEASQDALVDFFESAPIPDEFKLLARMACGEFPEGEPKTSSASSPARAIHRLREAIAGPTGGALKRYVPGLDDPGLHFLVFSYTFFLQTYMMRTLIERLPEMLQALGAAQTGEDPLDIGPR